ncbi:MAG: DUF255 domain-containing protein [Saprospiraceae bacterium]|nr:thioredoxin family protein [Bacteroidia bacterium]MBT8230791.1 thioredoxin family protein [Bacteroidia bacterium]NNF20816.1 DUF255 domain-containing protein [Saprospiraceae bacterium]NNK89582.1 DUF255 domain-containing protein [Saprospiraceae bacterium]
MLGSKYRTITLQLSIVKFIIISILFIPITDISAQKDKINFQYSLTKALRMAVKQDKHIFAYVHTDWSNPCQEMEESTFRDSVMIRELNENFINLSIDITRNRKFSENYKVLVFPTILLIDKYGNAFLRFVGYKDVRGLLFNLDKIKSQNRYLRQDLDSLANTLNSSNILSSIDSIEFYRDDFSAKNLIKKYLDKNRNWDDSVHMILIKDYFNLDKKYLKYISRHHKVFYERFDELSIKENIAFHVFINSLKKDARGRPVFNFRPVKRWFKRHKMDDIDKMESFVMIKYLLWGRGPSVKYSVNLLKNYPETSDENVFFASVIRLLISKNRRTPDYEELISSIRSTLDKDSSFWKYDALSLLYYKMGEDSKAENAIILAKARARDIGEDYEPTLPLIKDKIER